MSETVVEIAGKHLGQTVSEYSELYDASLLVKVPRHFNRDAYGIDESNLPFVGFDVWNAYEVSALTTKGRPVTGVLKIVYPSDSKYHVESKSIKLYLNSFNMTPFGNNKEECIQIIQSFVAKDLSDLLECDVQCVLHTNQDMDPFANDTWIGYSDYNNVEDVVNLDDVDFTQYKSDASQLEKSKKRGVQEVRYYTDLLRSNCRVTNQPDWGDIYVYMKGKGVVTAESFAKYIVSHRKVSHFHEEICEMVYKHLLDRFNPEELMVTCLYTRRGGIDINPVRASHEHLLDEEFIDCGFCNEKTLRI
jgi:7-cyano-7-deazaguanine reductase